MKHNMNRVLSIIALLMLTIGAWAEQTVNVTVLPEQNAGTVIASDVFEGKCTLTVTPADGYYATLENIKVELIVSGSNAQAPRRTPNISNDIEVTEITQGADPSGVTRYEFQMPEDEDLSVEVTVEFETRISISDAVVTLDQNSFTYDGTEKEPSVVSVMLGNKTLETNEYSVSYSNNINVSAAASPTVTVTGARQYTGTATATFAISAKTITIDMITLSPSSFVYSAEVQTPEVMVVDLINNEDYQLGENDYEISYQKLNGETATTTEETREVGTYNVVVTGKGNYGGTATKSFAITKAPLELSVTLEGWTYGNTPEKIAPKVDGNVGKGSENYYFKVKDADDNTYTTTIPENAGDYTMKVEVAESDNYASGSATCDFTIEKAPLPVGGENGLKVTLVGWKYGAEGNSPSVTGNVENGNVTYTYKAAGATEFIADQPTAVGTHTVKATVSETANYLGGEATTEFAIEKGDLSMVRDSIPEELVYDGTAKQLIFIKNVPEGATAKYNFTAIDKSDYENDGFQLLCDPSDDMFTATVPTGTNAGYYALVYKVFGGDNYNDILASQTIKIAINPAEITEVALKEDELTYTSLAQEVTITSVKAGTLVLTENDYTVSYEKINADKTISPIDATEVKAVGSYNIVVTGKGNFTGTTSATFIIVNRILDEGEVTFHNNWATYYSNDGVVELPAGIGAYIVLPSGIGENTVEVTPIKYIPKNVPVLLNNETTTTTENISVEGNMLRHVTETPLVVSEQSDLIYGLYNGKMMRVSGTIPVGKNYLLVPVAVAPAEAPQLAIVFDNSSTEVKGVKEVREVKDNTWFTLDGRKVQKTSKKGLYIQKGHKVVIK